MNRPFIADVVTLRRRAKKHFEEGSAKRGDTDRETAIKLLNDALTIELACARRFDRHRHIAEGLKARGIAAEFAQHAMEERDHVDRLAEQIARLGGKPDPQEGLDPEEQDADCTDLVEMVREDLAIERIVIATCGKIMGYLGSDQPASKELMESVVAAEEDHSRDLASLLREIRQESLEMP